MELTMQKGIMIRALFTLCALGQSFACVGTPWTWFHKKYMAPAELKKLKSKKQLTFAKRGIPAFNQLIFSWNALRPTQGFFTFYVQVRNAKTKKWSTWHKMASWGHEVQKSYISERDAFSSYHYVRLESSPASMSDSFTIKIISELGADLALIQSLGVSVSNFSQFENETESALAGLSTVFVKGVPRYSQFELDHPRNDGLCSPTSCSMMVSYLLSRPIDPLLFAQGAYDRGLEKYGSWPFNTAHAFELSHGKISFSVVRLPSCKNLYKLLARNLPVVVSVRGYIEGAPKAYNNGHLLVVVGYDSKSKEFICHDPAVAESKLVTKKYAAKSFLLAWEKSHRLAYIAEPIT